MCHMPVLWHAIGNIWLTESMTGDKSFITVVLKRVN